MIKSVLLQIKKPLFVTIFCLLIVLNYGFGPEMTEQEWLDWSNTCLLESYNPPPEFKLKKWELEVTPAHFVRMRKVFPHGKQEYFAFDLKRFAEANFLEGKTVDTLQLVTNHKDIIVQTYGDRKGNVDSMTNILNIPVKAMSPERIDSLNNALNFFKEKAIDQ